MDNSGMGAKEKEAIGKTIFEFDPSVSSNLGRSNQRKTRINPWLSVRIVKKLGVDEGYFMISQTHYDIGDEKKKQR